MNGSDKILLYFVSVGANVLMVDDTGRWFRSGNTDV